MRTSGIPVRRVGNPGVFTNAVTAKDRSVEPATPRLNIICLDTINTPFLDQGRARADLIKFLAKSVERGELTTLLTLDRSGVHVVHDFTTDSAVLIAALQRVKGKSEMMSGENVNALNNDADLNADSHANGYSHGNAASHADGNTSAASCSEGIKRHQ